MSESDDLFAVDIVDRLDALMEELRDPLDRRQDVRDVPLHQRGFGVMEEEPHNPLTRLDSDR